MKLRHQKMLHIPVENCMVPNLYFLWHRRCFNIKPGTKPISDNRIESDGGIKWKYLPLTSIMSFIHKSIKQPLLSIACSLLQYTTGCFRFIIILRIDWDRLERIEERLDVFKFNPSWLQIIAQTISHLSLILSVSNHGSVSVFTV